MAMTLNKSFLLNEKYATIADYQIISAAGPLSTLTQAIVIFIVMKHSKIKWLYSFLFTCFYMRFFAAIISFLNPNDEARVSKFLGIGTFTLPIIMVAFLFFFVYKISKQYKFGYRFIAINLGLVILFSSIIILADQFFFIRLLWVSGKNYHHYSSPIHIKRGCLELLTAGGTIFISTDGGLFKTADNGKTWKRVHSQGMDGNLAELDGVLVAISMRKIIISTDYGENWEVVEGRIRPAVR
jgi:hypothetical protein